MLFSPTRFALFLCASLSLSAASAWAAGAAPPPLAHSLTGSAKDAFDSAQNLLETRDYVGAGAKLLDR